MGMTTQRQIRRWEEAQRPRTDAEVKPVCEELSRLIRELETLRAYLASGNIEPHIFHSTGRLIDHIEKFHHKNDWLRGEWIRRDMGKRVLSDILK